MDERPLTLTEIDQRLRTHADQAERYQRQAYQAACDKRAATTMMYAVQCRRELEQAELIWETSRRLDEEGLVAAKRQRPEIIVMPENYGARERASQMGRIRQAVDLANRSDKLAYLSRNLADWQEE